jgi:hypothetical protein
MASAQMPLYSCAESRQALRCRTCNRTQLAWILDGRWRCTAETCGSQNDEGPAIDELPISRRVADCGRTGRRWADLGLPDRRANPGRRHYDKQEVA